MEIQEGKAGSVRGLEKEGSCPWSLGALLSGQGSASSLLCQSLTAALGHITQHGAHMQC